MQESPDFILKINGELTGVELTSIHDSSVIKDVKYFDNLCKKMQQQLIDNKVVSKKLYDIHFDKANPWKGNSKDQVTDLVGYLESKFRCEKPAKLSYIRELNISPVDGVQVKLSEVYQTKPINAGDVDELIRQKEAKIADYRKNSGIERQWLLIIQEGSSTEANFEVTPDMLPRRRFDFDKIILFDTFKGVAIGTLDTAH